MSNHTFEHFKDIQFSRLERWILFEPQRWRLFWFGVGIPFFALFFAMSWAFLGAIQPSILDPNSPFTSLAKGGLAAFMSFACSFTAIGLIGLGFKHKLFVKISAQAVKGLIDNLDFKQTLNSSGEGVVADCYKVYPALSGICRLRFCFYPPPSASGPGQLYFTPMSGGCQVEGNLTEQDEASLRSFLSRYHFESSDDLSQVARQEPGQSPAKATNAQFGRCFRIGEKALLEIKGHPDYAEHRWVKIHPNAKAYPLVNPDKHAAIMIYNKTGEVTFPEIVREAVAAAREAGFCNEEVILLTSPTGDGVLLYFDGNAFQGFAPDHAEDPSEEDWAEVVTAN